VLLTEYYTNLVNLSIGQVIELAVVLEINIVFVIKYRERNMTVPEIYYIA